MLKHFIVVLVSLFHSAAFAQSTSSRVFEDWNLVCPAANTSSNDKPACHLSQTILAEDQKSPLLLASVANSNGDLVLILTVPLGIDLGKGLAWIVDANRARQLIFNTCTHDGCFAAIRLTSPVLNELRRGVALQTKYTDGVGKPVEALVSLRGFTAGTKKLYAEK